ARSATLQPMVNRIVTTTTLASSSIPALVGITLPLATAVRTAAGPPTINPLNPPTVTFSFVDPGCATCTTTSSPIGINAQGLASKIGRASCRDRVMFRETASGHARDPAPPHTLQQLVTRLSHTTFHTIF